MFNCLDTKNNKFLTSPWLLSNDFSCNFQVVLRNVRGCVTQRKGYGLGPRGGTSNLSVYKFVEKPSPRLSPALAWAALRDDRDIVCKVVLTF